MSYIVVVDVETTGPNPYVHFMLEMAASVWKIGAKKPLETFYRAMTAPPENNEWREKTLTEFWNNPQHGRDGKTPMEALEARLADPDHPPVEPAAAMKDFVEWIRDAADKIGDDVVLVSDTNGFDMTWLNAYLGRFCHQSCETVTELFGEYRPVHQLDAFYFGVAGALSAFGSEKAAMKTLGIDELPDWVKLFSADHHPLNDANSIGATASFLLTAAKEAKRASSKKRAASDAEPATTVDREPFDSSE